MRALIRTGALTGRPLQVSCRRALSSTPQLCSSKKPPKPHKGKNLSKLSARSRSDSANDHSPKARLRQDTGKSHSGRHSTFRSITLHTFEKVLKSIGTNNFAVAGLGDDELDRQAALFMNALDHAFLLAEQNITHRDKNPLFWTLRDAFISKEIQGLTKELRYSFQAFLVRQRFNKETEGRQQRMLDFRYPHEWFPATRTLQRTIHVHVGPTNSGKTYNAIKALENSKRGVYAGPLRLLANEIYQRLQAKGLPCALVTGEEVRIPEDTDNFFTSCTVEMIPVNIPFDVAVIDEIQMIADSERGSAWTTALLGVQAKEVHVCGEERTVKLLEAICASIGDKCVIHRYERLSPLETMETAVGNDFANLQKGDAIVAFSRLSLHALKRKVEAATGRRCAIIYGALPPEVRVQQAALFNNPDNDYDFIVASDAIGMGLNLEIRRVIMESVTKYDGSQNRLLTYPEIKQIGGRAGRYRTAQSAIRGDGESAGDGKKQGVGYVTTLDQTDLYSVQRAFRREVPDIDAAVIHPPAGIIERFASYFPPQTPLSYMFMRIKAMATTAAGYSLYVPADAMTIADIIHDFPLNISDRLTLCWMPSNPRIEGGVEIIRAMARVIAENTSGALLSIPELPLEVLDLEPDNLSGMGAPNYLYKLEALHVSINQYLWLSYRYAGMFRDRELAFHVRSLVEQKLIDSLERMDFTEDFLESQRLNRRRHAQKIQDNVDKIGEGPMEDEGEHETDQEPVAEPAWGEDLPAQEEPRVGAGAP